MIIIDEVVKNQTLEQQKRFFDYCLTAKPLVRPVVVDTDFDLIVSEECKCDMCEGRI